MFRNAFFLYKVRCSFYFNYITGINDNTNNYQFVLKKRIHSYIQLNSISGDLDRIKSTSFFQRVPPPSEVKRKEEEAEAFEAEQNQKPEPELTEEEKALEAAKAAIVPVSESESEEEDEDDIFDTAYIDALAAGEVKLAYIPGKITFAYIPIIFC